MTSAQKEDYLQTIYRMQQSSSNPVSVSGIAKLMDVAKPSVTQMIKKLDSEGTVQYRRYGSITLTEKGVIESRRLIRKHRLLERFLHDVLGLNEVHAEAHSLEHAVSDRVADKIEKMMDHPTVCPDGDPIPDIDKDILTLDKAKSNANVRVILSKVTEPTTSKRLISLGILPNSTARVIKKLKDGPVLLEVKGSEVALGADITKLIFVEVM